MHRPAATGAQQFCEHIQDYNRPGMAETVTWHESQVYKLPDDVSLLKGCLLEPTSVAVRIADKTRIKVGDRVAICGGGPIGQLALQVMKMNGATSLTLIEPIAERREMALRHGADVVIDPVSEDQYARADDDHGWARIRRRHRCLRLVRARCGACSTSQRRARRSSTARCTRHDFEMPLNLSDYLYLKELTLTGVFVSPYAFPRALQILPYLELDELTQSVFDLDDAAEAFAVHVSGRYRQGRHPLQRHR